MSLCPSVHAQYKSSYSLHLTRTTNDMLSGWTEEYTLLDPGLTLEVELNYSGAIISITDWMLSMLLGACPFGLSIFHDTHPSHKITLWQAHQQQSWRAQTSRRRIFNFYPQKSDTVLILMSSFLSRERSMVEAHWRLQGIEANTSKKHTKYTGRLGSG